MVGISLFPLRLSLDLIHAAVFEGPLLVLSPQTAEDAQAFTQQLQDDLKAFRKSARVRKSLQNSVGRVVKYDRHIVTSFLLLL